MDKKRARFKNLVTWCSYVYFLLLTIVVLSHFFGFISQETLTRWIFGLLGVFLLINSVGFLTTGMFIVKGSRIKIEKHPILCFLILVSYLGVIAFVVWRFKVVYFAGQ